MSELTVAASVDACGLTCPMPLLKAKKAMGGMEPGQVLELVTTDRGALKDIPAWARAVGHEIAGIEQAEGMYRIFVRRGA